MNFVGEFKEKPKKIFLVHGEEEAQNVLKGKIEEEFGIDTEIPSFGDVFRVDEIVEKEENLLEKEKVVATREEKIEFANKVSDLNEEISMLSDTIADRMTHVHVKSENIVNDTDMGILQEVLIKLGKLEDPEFKVKEAIVVTLYPGASPESVEQEVVEFFVFIHSLIGFTTYILADTSRKVIALHIHLESIGDSGIGAVIRSCRPSELNRFLFGVGSI